MKDKPYVEFKVDAPFYVPRRTIVFTNIKYYGGWLLYGFWYVVHNLIAHPLLIIPIPLTSMFHDWTADRMIEPRRPRTMATIFRELTKSTVSFGVGGHGTLDHEGKVTSFHPTEVSIVAPPSKYSHGDQ